MKSRILRSYTISTISIALVLFILGSIGYAVSSLIKTAHEAREGVVMMVEIEDNLTEGERDSLKTEIATSALVGSVKFVSKEEKLQDEGFRRAFNVDIEEVLGSNPLPDSFDVTLTAQAEDREAVKNFVEKIKTLKGVSYISYPEDLLSQVHSVLGTMQLLLLLFGGAMLLIALILLNNTIRLTIFSRREAINTMKLVGATHWFIIKPFIGRSALQGFIAGVVAALLFVGGLFALDYTLAMVGFMSQLKVIAIVAAALVVAGVVIATLFTLFAVRRFVKMRSNKIYMY